MNDTAAELAKLFGGHLPPKLPDKPKAKEAKARKVKVVRPREPQPVITKTKEEEDIDELEKDSTCLRPSVHGLLIIMHHTDCITDRKRLSVVKGLF